MHYPYVSDQETMQNVTIEERVALVEIQVADIEGDISLLIENDNFLFDEQIIQTVQSRTRNLGNRGRYRQ